MDTLEDVLEGAAETPAEEPAGETPEPEKEPEKSTSPVDEDKVVGLTAELTRIRQKNRELEQENQTLKTPKTEKPDLWADTEAWESSLRNEFQGEMLKTRISISEDMARSQFQDYDEKASYFMEMAKKTPALVEDMRNAISPARFAYETAKRQMLVDKLGDPDAYEAGIRQQVRTELEAQIRKEYEDKLGKELPTSLSDTRAAGGVKTPVIDESLEDVMGRDATHRS